MRDMVCVGAIAGAFGVRGEVRLKSFCAEPADIGAYGPLSTEDGRSFRGEITRPVKGGLAARLSGVATREAAEALRGTRLHAPRAALPEPEADEYYHADLVGLAVVDGAGAPLGQVRAVHDHGAGAVLELRTPDGGERLIPFTAAAVPRVEIAAGRLVADPPAETDAPGAEEAP